MDLQAVIASLREIANTRDNGDSKLFRIDDAILIPLIVSAVTAATKGNQPTGDKSLVGDIIRAAGGIVKSPDQQKLFGIDDAILIPAIASVIAAAVKENQSGS